MGRGHQRLARETLKQLTMETTLWKSCAWTALTASILLTIGCGGGGSPAPQMPDPFMEAGVEHDDWNVYLGDSGSSQYSTLDQINKENVGQLELAWMTSTGDSDSRSQIQCNPIIVDGVVYAVSPMIKAIAMDAKTGEMLWQFDPFEGGFAQGVTRGVTYWEDGDDKRILYSAGSYIYALNAKTGELIPEFDDDGKVSLHDGLDRDVTNQDIVSTTPGIVYKDLLIMGTRVSEGYNGAPGHIRAYHIPTGERAWIFHTIPLPGQFGYDTWPEGAHEYVGGANSWAGMALDEERGIVYIPTGSPSFDFYGGNRIGDNLFGNTLIALNAETGERIWHFQIVKHDLWDRDIPQPPTLLTVNQNGQLIDAVAQLTKHGMVFLFNRETGEPLFPIEYRQVPASTLRGEVAAETQPYVTKPAPLVRQIFSLREVTDRTPEAREYIMQMLEGTNYGNTFTPPSLDGTIIFPGFDGGAEWGGSAVDPTRGVLYVNVTEMAWLHQMVEIDNTAEGATPGRLNYMKYCAACHKSDLTGEQHLYPTLVNIGDRLEREEVLEFIVNGRGRMPGYKFLTQEEQDSLIAYLYGEEKPVEEPAAEVAEEPKEATVEFRHTGYNRLFDEDGFPGIKPPWGKLHAIDMSSGEYLWTVLLGEHKELVEQGYPPTGAENYGGPVVTAGGLIFIAGTPDEKIRAFDKDTGELLWEYQMPFAGYATPATYMVDGKQYVVIAAGGGKIGTPSGDAYMAFALPE